VQAGPLSLVFESRFLTFNPICSIFVPVAGKSLLPAD
jgi:hypothetical protein